MPAPIIHPTFTRLLDRLERTEAIAWGIDRVSPADRPTDRSYRMAVHVRHPQTGAWLADLGTHAATLQELAEAMEPELHQTLAKLVAEGLLPKGDEPEHDLVVMRTVTTATGYCYGCTPTWVSSRMNLGPELSLEDATEAIQQQLDIHHAAQGVTP